MLNPILSSSNTTVASTALTVPVEQVPWVPLGKTGDGEIYLKVSEIAPSGTSSDQVQGTAADNAAAVGNPVYVAGKAVDPATYAPAYTAGDAAAIPISKDTGRVLVEGFVPGTGSVAVISAATASTTLSASNASRLGLAVTNNSTAVLYVKLGADAASTSFTAPLAALSGGIGGYYEVPFNYKGIVTGVWAAADGNAQVTTLTA